MRQSLGLAAVAVAIIAFTLEDASADSFVRCPTREANTAIIDSLPPGWEIVQGKAPLTDTRVETGRGQDRLQCIYGTSGVLEMRGPRRETCEVVRGGFLCRSGAREPRVVAEGVLRVSQGYTVDLDSGRITSATGADIWLQADNYIQTFLAPIGSAGIARVGGSEPGPRECERASYGAERVPLIEMLRNGWICYSTDRGRRGRLRVSAVNLFPVTVDIEFTTWE